MEKNRKFMQEAIDLSRLAITEYDGGPFGCIIVKDDKVIGRGWNHVIAENDPTAHAEVMAIRDACKRMSTPELIGCELYTSSEPCPMCMAAIYWACISKVYYSNTIIDSAGMGYEDSIIYEEFRKPMQERKIEMIHLFEKDSVRVFEEWKAKKQ